MSHRMPLESTRHEVWGDQPDRPREKGFSIDPWTIVVWSAILLTALGYAAVSSWRTPGEDHQDIQSQKQLLGEPLALFRK